MMPNDSVSVDAEQCLAAWEISHQPHLIILTVATICVCIFGLITIGLFAFYLYKTAIYHVHIRLLLWNLCVALSLLMCGIAYLSADHLLLFSLYQNDPCRMVVNQMVCKMKRRLVYVTPKFIVESGVLATAIERGYATYHYSGYETKRSTLTTLVAIGILWIWSTWPLLLSLLEWEQGLETMPYCITLLINPGSINGSRLFIIIYLVILGYLVALLAINRKLQRRKVGAEEASANGKHLSERYQLAENVKATRMLIPSLACVLGAQTTTACVMYYISTAGTIDNNEDVVRLAVYNQQLSFIMSLVAPTFCITCLVQSRRLSKYMDDQVKRLRLQKLNSVARQHVQDLEKYWATKKPPPQRH